MASARSHVDTVTAAPLKRFFVEMLTRDIALEDAILDLLDNCVDGIQRTIRAPASRKRTPYESYHATITFGADMFSIADNCGGIPWNLRKQAFRIGRGSANAAPSNVYTVGAYGIGLKRAIFKIGRQAIVKTKTLEDAYEVTVPEGWMEEEDNWTLETRDALKPLKEPGTTVSVTHLVADAAATFKEEAFQKALYEKISTHFAIIINKGLKITITFFGRTVVVQPKTVALRFQRKAERNAAVIRPYVFHSIPDADVEVTVFVGLREPIPEVEATLSAQEEPTYSTDYAGVTVICNDRVVLYCNRDELTGWGTAKVPSYHTQFIAISGYVEFRGDPKKLPTTTTKRGLEYSSRLYQQVLDRVRDGLRMFIDYTNWWKANEVQAKRQVVASDALSFAELKAKISDTSLVPMRPVRTGLVGEQYRPSLPRPNEESSDVRIAYSRPRLDVLRVAKHKLKRFDEFAERDVPKALGEYLFDAALSALPSDR